MTVSPPGLAGHSHMEEEALTSREAEPGAAGASAAMAREDEAASVVSAPSLSGSACRGNTTQDTGAAKAETTGGFGSSAWAETPTGTCLASRTSSKTRPFCSGGLLLDAVGG